MAATIVSAAQSITSPFAPAIRRALRRSTVIAAAILLLAIAHLSLLDGSALAGDVASAMRPWIVQELTGAAFSRSHDADESQWQALGAGAQIEPGSIVRTDGSARMELTNGIDTIRLSPSTEIELPVGQNGDPVTRVIHWIGTAFFHVGKRPGPQFEVDTPYIVAIVKGTKFTTAVSEAGASIKVSEGVVGVSAAAGGPSIDVTAGGSASVSAAHSDTLVPGPSGDAGPAGGRGKGSTLAGSNNDADVGSGVVSDAGGALSGGADVVGSGGGATARGGRGTHGSNGNGRGRDTRENDGSSAAVRNDGGQGGVDGDGDGDDGGGDNGNNGGGCLGHGDHHYHGNHHDDPDHGGYRH
jgi:hypothetical protein